MQTGLPQKKNQRKYAKACVSERVFQDFRDNSVKEGVCYNRLYDTDLYAYKWLGGCRMS